MGDQFDRSPHSDGASPIAVGASESNTNNETTDTVSNANPPAKDGDAVHCLEGPPVNASPFASSQLRTVHEKLIQQAADDWCAQRYNEPRSKPQASSQKPSANDTASDPEEMDACSNMTNGIKVEEDLYDQDAMDENTSEEFNSEPSVVATQETPIKVEEDQYDQHTRDQDMSEETDSKESRVAIQEPAIKVEEDLYGQDTSFQEISERVSAGASFVAAAQELIRNESRRNVVHKIKNNAAELDAAGFLLGLAGGNPNKNADQDTPEESSPDRSLSSDRASIAPSEMADEYKELHALTGPNGAGVDGTGTSSDGYETPSNLSHGSPTRSRAGKTSSQRTRKKSADVESTVGASKNDSKYSPARVPQGFLINKMAKGNGSKVEISVRIVVDGKEQDASGKVHPNQVRSRQTKKKSTMDRPENTWRRSGRKTKKKTLAAGNAIVDLNAEVVRPPGRAKKKKPPSNGGKETVVVDQMRRSGRAKKKSVEYNEDFMVVDNAPVSNHKEAEKLIGVEQEADEWETEQSLNTKLPSSGSRRKSGNKSFGNSDLSTAKSAVPDASHKSASASLNSNDRKRKQAVIGDSDGEMQNVKKKQALEVCPLALGKMFDSDFRKQQNKLSTKYADRLVARIWSQTPVEIKLSIPTGEGENAEQELRDWKVKHFGELAPIPNFHGCPDQVVPLLREDFAHHTELSEKVIGEKIRMRWRRVSKVGKKKLPDPSKTNNYTAELKKWKLRYLPDAADEVTSVPPPSRSRSNNSENHDDGAQYAERHASSSSKHITQDPNQFYVEEEAHRYHNPPLPSMYTEGVKPQDIMPVPPPPLPFKELPDTGKCKWSWDDTQRIILADFSCSVSSSNAFAMDPGDEAFFLEMMERNDITLISEGLISAKSLKPDLWKPEYLRRVLKNEYYHKFRRFDTLTTKEGFERYFEVDGMISMKVGDYITYLEKRQDYLQGKDGAEPSFSFLNHEGKPEELHVGESALYMIDVDSNRLLPKLHANFLESFRYHGVLPGGSHCLMNSVTSTARPFMGPNLYVTPPATFTHFHQDGHGTVDSGHLCINGYNEVVMLRRLTERHKQHALMILTGNFGREKGGKGKGKDKDPLQYFDGLYSEPHGDQLGEKPSWPTEAQIEKCRDMGYCPTVCMVKPGQLIHINKGRLHAFRKMSTATLPKGDCHKKLREETVEKHKLTKETLCVSIAWDWMYRGVTEGGINREVNSVLEAVVLNRKNGRVSLAIPEFSLFQTAKVLNSDQATAPKLDSFVGFGTSDGTTVEDKSIPDARTLSRGILPSLRHMVKQQLKTMRSASSATSQCRKKGERVTIAKRPNTHEDPSKFPLDPYGLDGFACKLCSRELSNVYYHCDGCEILLSKDFNICRECHRDKKFMMTIQMHPTNPKKHASLNHTGKMNYDRVSRCPCKNGPVCGHCNFCMGCSCRCHTWFTLHSRMFGVEDGEALLSGVERAAECIPCDGEKSEKYGELLAERLEAAAKAYTYDAID